MWNILEYNVKMASTRENVGRNYNNSTFTRTKTEKFYINIVTFKVRLLFWVILETETNIKTWHNSTISKYTFLLLSLFLSLVWYDSTTSQHKKKLYFDFYTITNLKNYRFLSFLHLIKLKYEDMYITLERNFNSYFLGLVSISKPKH